MINADDRMPRQSITAIGRAVSVAVAGEGPPVVFIHGNATYSYAWRNIIAYLAHRHRCLAIDLPGMGRSDVIFPSGPSTYAFQDQMDFLGITLDLLVPDGRFVLVGHELGGTMAIEYTRMNPGRVAGLVLVEAAFRVSNDEQFDDDLRKLIIDVRGEAGELMVLRENAIIEEYLPRLTSRVLSPAEMKAYREPFRTQGESRRAMLTMLRQLPLKTQPGPLDELAAAIRLWCAHSTVPKLVVGGNPGFLVNPSVLGTAARWPETTTVSIPGKHFLMEDSPGRLTVAILDWLEGIGWIERHR